MKFKLIIESKVNEVNNKPHNILIILWFNVILLINSVVFLMIFDYLFVNCSTLCILNDFFN